MSYSVGLEILEETYKEVLQIEDEKPSVALIDLSVRLDHFRSFPEHQVEKMAADLRANFFAYTVLRDLVADHLYLFNVDFKTMQRVGKWLDIKTSSPRYLQPRAKKTSRHQKKGGKRRR